MKMTPKSCGCNACRAGRGSPYNKAKKRNTERAFRQNIKKSLKEGREVLYPAPYGDYTD